jgi:hypothetical protein
MTPPSPQSRHFKSADDARAHVQSDAFKADLAEAQRLVQEGDLEGLAAFASRDVDERARLAAARTRGTLFIEVTAGDAEMVASWAESGLRATGQPNDVAWKCVERFRKAFNDAARKV